MAFAAFLLGLPSVTLGPVLDDHGFRRRLLIEHGEPNAAFHFDAGSDGRLTGRRSWWSDPPSERRFMRPLSALTHWLDYRLWPDAVAWMRFSNCVLYALLAWLAAVGYARLIAPGAIAALAGLMFAADEAHAHSLSMVATRNTLLSAVFGLAALLAHHAQRSSPHRLRRGLGPLLFAFALLAGEGGIATLGYLAAYAFCLDDEPWAQRARSLLPYGLLAALWLWLYIAGGYGAGDGVGNGQFYRDPRTDPLGAITSGVLDLPVWLASQLTLSVATATIEASVPVVRLVAAVLMLGLGLVLQPTLRESRSARFCALGLLMSIAPLLLTVPQDRLLVMASFGGFGLIACFLAREARLVRERVTRPLLIALHLVIAPIAFIPSYLLVGAIPRAEAKVEAALPSRETAARTGVVIVRAPLPGTLGYALARRASHDEPLPLYTYELYAAAPAVAITRIDSHTLELAPRDGYCTSRAECIGTNLVRGFRAGQSIELSFMRAEVRAVTAANAPLRVRFHFPSPLESKNRRWLTWTAGGLRPFTPPALHETVTLPRLSPLTAFR